MKILLLMIFLVNSVFACPVEKHEMALARLKGFALAGESESGLTEEDFRSVFTRVKDHYDKIFADQGLEVRFDLDWNNAWLNAQTGWVGEKKIFFFFSGELARARFMTRDGLMFVACHEFGHHLGGVPKKKWATAEGGADYFASLKCFRDILRNDPENASAEKLALPETVIRKCREVYSDDDEFRICLRAVKGGQDMTRALKFARSPTEIPGSLLFVNLPSVTETNVGYPSYECRAETAYQGAICPRGPEFPVSFTNEADGYCHEKNGDTFGMRPRCWFKPTLE